MRTVEFDLATARSLSEPPDTPREVLFLFDSTDDPAPPMEACVARCMFGEWMVLSRELSLFGGARGLTWQTAPDEFLARAVGWLEFDEARSGQ